MALTLEFLFNLFIYLFIFTHLFVLLNKQRKEMSMYISNNFNPILKTIITPSVESRNP